MIQYPMNKRDCELYHREGYIVIEKVFSATDLLPVENAIIELTNRALAHPDQYDFLELEPDQVDNRQVPRRIYSPYDQHEAFRSLATDPRILDHIETLIGTDFDLHHSKLNMKPARVGSPVEWHQDLAFFPHTNDRLVTTLVYLDDANQTNGCLQVLPRMHQQFFSHEAPDGAFAGMITEDVSGDRYGRPVPLEAPAGSVIFMHCNTPHSSLPNRSTRPRRTLIFEYRAGDAYPVFYGHQTIEDEAGTRPLRGKRARYARFGGLEPLMPIHVAPTAIYDLQADMKAKLESMK